MKFGYNDDWQLYEVAAKAKAGGATIARSGTAYGPVMQYGWDYTDRFAWRVSVAGLTPVISISGMFPESLPRGDYPQVYADFTTAVAQRYPEAILESWNEPNMQPRFGDLTPKEMGACYRAARTALSPRPLLTPALAPRRGWQSYFQDMNLPKDAPLACHPYPSLRAEDQIASVREQINWYEKNHRGEIHVTEIGISTSEQSEADQADLLVRIYKMFERRERAVSVIVHRLIDPTHWEGASDWEKGCGTLHGDESPKLSYGALATAVQ